MQQQKNVFEAVNKVERSSKMCDKHHGCKSLQPLLCFTEIQQVLVVIVGSTAGTANIP